MRLETASVLGIPVRRRYSPSASGSIFAHLWVAGAQTRMSNRVWLSRRIWPGNAWWIEGYKWAVVSKRYYFRCCTRTCVILTELLFRLLLSADQNLAKFCALRIEIHICDVEMQRCSTEIDVESCQNQSYGPPLRPHSPNTTQMLDSMQKPNSHVCEMCLNYIYLGVQAEEAGVNLTSVQQSLPMNHYDMGGSREL